MKDSFGGTVMLYILIIFLGIYVVFIALTLRYAQSFRIKNKIIDIIEEKDGNAEDDVNDYISNLAVDPDSVSISLVKNNDVRNTCYYKVSSKIKWEWPFFGINGNWVIKGETKNVFNCDDIIINKN